MDVIKVKDAIENLIDQLQKAKLQLKLRSKRKAETIAEYDKVLAVTIIKLKNGVDFKLEDVETTNLPATIIEKVAKGICWKERLAMEEADAEYKSLITYIEVTQAQLTGFQSINRYLE